MRKFLITLGVFFLLFAYCSNRNQFKKATWLGNNSLSDYRNPRMRMIDDLLKNHLKEGMTKEQVIELLGEPYKDGISKQVPRDLPVPDSISIIKSFKDKRSAEEKEIIREKYFAWAKENRQPDTLLWYAAGWTWFHIDPYSLVIKLNGEGVTDDFWLHQH